MTLRVISLKIDEELLEKIDRYCFIHGISRSELIRKAVIEYISNRRHVIRIRKVVIR